MGQLKLYKGLVGQIGGLVEKFSTILYMIKCPVHQSEKLSVELYQTKDCDSLATGYMVRRHIRQGGTQYLRVVEYFTSIYQDRDYVDLIRDGNVRWPRRVLPPGESS